MNTGVPLSKAIQSLRGELETAMSAGEGARLRFEATEVELTLQTEVTTAGGGKAGIKWWLLEAGAEASRERQATQTVVLKLKPKLQGGGSALLSGDDD